MAFAARDVDDGAAAAQTATITNSGSEPVTLTAVTLTGDTTQFARLTGATGDCTTTTQLDAGESCTLRVRFDPTSTGAKTATLTVESNAAPVAVGLTGTGTQTALSRTPATLAFGARDVGAGPTAVQSATIANAGSETVTLTALTLTGDTTQFALLGGEATDCTPTTQLGSGETCTLRFRFDPTSTGAKAASMAVDSNAATVTVALAGQGVHLELARSPASLAFGARDVDTGPAAEPDVDAHEHRLGRGHHHRLHVLGRRRALRPRERERRRLLDHHAASTRARAAPCACASTPTRSGRRRPR